MKKRALAGVLWFYASWYAWAMVASLASLPEFVGPIIGAAAGAFVALDPFGRIWNTAREAPGAGAPEVQGALRS